MAIKTDEAFVLTRMCFRETSMILTLFAKEAGKIKLLLKGVRGEKNPKLARFEPFTKVSVVYYEKLRSDLHLGSQLEILDAQLGLRNQLSRIAFASYLTELVDTLFAAQDPHEDVYDLLEASFECLQHFTPSTVARVFELKILEKIGWLPMLQECAGCGTEDLFQSYFSPRQGGVLCLSCKAKDSSAFPVSKMTCQTLVYFLSHDLSDAVQRELSPSSERELARIGERFLRFHLDYPLRSTRFLSEVRFLLAPSR